MLTLEQITQIEGILSSDRVSLKGHEAMGYAIMLQKLRSTKEMMEAAMRNPPPQTPASRVTPKVPESPPSTPEKES